MADDLHLGVLPFASGEEDRHLAIVGLQLVEACGVGHVGAEGGHLDHGCEGAVDGLRGQEPPQSDLTAVHQHREEAGVIDSCAVGSLGAHGEGVERLLGGPGPHPLALAARIEHGY